MEPYALRMLEQQSVVSVAYRSADDALVIATSPHVPHRGRVSCGVLLDKNGFLVGIDLDPDGKRRVLMLGEHEDVAKQQSGSVTVTALEIVLIGAREFRGHERNPYLQR
jgi:hypothetical protein